MIKQFTLKNKFLEVTILNLGGIIHAIKMPDEKGKIENIIHGFDTIEAYENNTAYFGAIVGRTAGRMRDGQYEINGKTYHMETGELSYGLHGGKIGFNQKIWNVEALEDRLILTYESLDGEEGYPGHLKVKVTYQLEENALHLIYEGISDKDTVCNLTNHSYFNLMPEKTVMDMKLQVASDLFLEIGDDMLPSGRKLPVANTPFDFNHGALIKELVDLSVDQYKVCNGLDHCYMLKGPVCLSSSNGRMVEMTSDQPAVVLYAYNYPLEGDVQHQGLAVEFQNEANGINQEGFNSSLLRKGEVYKQHTTYRFMVNHEKRAI